MTNINFLNSLRVFLITLFLGLCVVPCLAWGDDLDNDDSLDLLNAWQGTSTGASRIPKPISQSAENITVLTAKEIGQLNAHTLADILDTVPGVQMQLRGAPGGVAFTYVQSTNYNHITVLLDGISINDLGDHFANVSAIPAQIIERVEIVKGSASSAWGQALGGVINVITKSPEQRKLGGSVTASIGERTTADTRAEITGTSGRLGYYLSSGYLGSNGISPNSALSLNSNSTYAKLAYALPGQGEMQASFNYYHTDRGTVYSPDILDFKEKQNVNSLLATLALNKPLSDSLVLDIHASHINDRQTNFDTLISSGSEWTVFGKSQISAVKASLLWRTENNTLVGGSDYEHVEYTNDSSFRKKDRWGVYLNDTLTLGPLSVSPGVRFDRTGTGDQVSAAFGTTWQVTDTTLLRAYTARGFGVFQFTQNVSPEKIWTSQVGAESTAIPYLWLKTTLFRNEIWNVYSSRNLDPAVPERRIALGAELEARTVPVFNTSLGAGYTFTDTVRTIDDHQVYESARHTLQLALRYDDSTYRGVLNGRHVYWNGVPGYGGKYWGLIWDLHLGATLLKRENSSLELFFTGHNLFNGKQFMDETLPNNSRWFEGGMRVRF
ncbi:MAG TPA: TonB-dependent receptor [Geobacter sp.]|nr:TonB-dependent receptor [Geobacter sp.]HCE68288.1 TonB-dependent receptor [Geobacter sp.]